MENDFLLFDGFSLSFSRKNKEKEGFEDLRFQILDEGGYIEFGDRQNFGKLNFLSDTYGTEHWISEASDFFRFSESGELAGLQLKTPLDTLNMVVNPLGKNNNHTYKCSLKEGYPKFAQPIENSIFDLKDRVIYCVNKNEPLSKNVKLINLSKDFFLIGIDGRYSGYGIRNPISNMRFESDESSQRIEKDSESDFLLLKEIFILLSSEHWDAMGNDPDKIVPEILKFIQEKFNLIDDEVFGAALLNVDKSLRDRFDIM